VTIPMHVTAFIAGLAGLFATTSCGGSAASACEIAHQKIKDCDVKSFRPNTIGAILLPLVGDTPEDCTDQNRCVARCVTDASCEAITFVVAGTSTDVNVDVNIPAGSEGFHRCLYGCAFD
jgi:hypothetical protein